MPKRIQDCTRAHLISVPLPQHAASYTVITHQFVIDYSFQALSNAGFGIVEEEYRCTADGQIAQGIYKLQYNNDPDLSMMFAWTNSYNKQVKFKCLIGAYINQTGTVMTSGDIGTWTRKHIGTADVETKATIDDQVVNAHMYYNQLVADKAIMTGISLNKRRQSQLLGILFAEYQILTTEQASIIRSQMDKPSHVYEDSNSLWAFYNYVTIALQHSHPRTWMEDQRILHYFISTVGNFSTPPQPVSTPVLNLSTPVDPLTTNYGEPENQTNLLVQIAETTGDDTVLLPQGINTELYHGMNELMKADEKMLMFGDDSGYKHIQEVLEKAAQDEVMFGISEIKVDENGSHHVPVVEILQKMQEESPIKGDEPPTLPVEPADYDFNKIVDYSKIAYPVTEEEVFKLPNNQVVQEEVEIEVVLHQSDEMIEEAIEDDKDEVLWHNDEVVSYTDPAGNTFEVPVVVDDFITDEEEDAIMDQILVPIPPCAAHDSETEKAEAIIDLSDLEGEYSLEEMGKVIETIEERIEEAKDLEEEIKETEVKNFFAEVEPSSTLVPTPEEHAIFEAEEAQKLASESEEANLDLTETVAEPSKNDDNADFDLDFASDDAEDDEVDNTPDFF